MCGRFTLRTPAKLLASWFHNVDFPVMVPRYNIAPTQQVLALRSNPGQPLAAVMLRWGLVPSWASDLKIGNQLINARSETAASKPAFRRAFKSRRCIILADGFYEWKQTPSGKQPYLIQSTDTERPLMCFAGLWERWHQPSVPSDSFEDIENRDSSKRASTKRASSQSTSKRPAAKQSSRQLDLFETPEVNRIEVVQKIVTEPKIVESCSILTTSANERMSTLHDRMPVILNTQSQSIWLDPEFEDFDRLGSLLQPCPSDQLRMHAVSKLVNKPAIDSLDCAEPIPSEEF